MKKNLNYKVIESVTYVNPAEVGEVEAGGVFSFYVL